MSDQLIASLQAEVNRLNSELASTRAEAKKYRLERRSLRSQLEEIQSERDQAHEALLALEQDRDSWQQQAESSPDDLQKQIQDLTGQIRTRDHRDAWASVKDQLHEKVDIDRLWKEIGYEPGETIPTAEQISEQVGKARESAPYLFQPGGETPPAAPSGQTQPPARLTAPPGGGRAGRDTSSGRMVVSRSRDLTNAEWMRANQSTLGEASKSGSVDWVD